MRLIDAHKLECIVATNMNKNEHTNRTASLVHRGEHMKFLRMIAEAKTIEAIPVFYATWDCVNENENVYMCSACGYEYILNDGTPKENEMNYCCRCGADMRGDELESKD